MVEGKSRKQALQSAFAQRALQNLFMFRARLCLDCHFQDHGTNYTSVSNAVTPAEKNQVNREQDENKNPDNQVGKPQGDVRNTEKSEAKRIDHVKNRFPSDTPCQKSGNK